MNIRDKIKKSHLEFAEQRGLESTYCPSEVARQVDPENWRELMNNVREVADELISDGQLLVMQKGKVIKENATNASGPIRLRKK